MKLRVLCVCVVSDRHYQHQEASMRVERRLVVRPGHLLREMKTGNHQQILQHLTITMSSNS